MIRVYDGLITSTPEGQIYVRLSDKTAQQIAIEDQRRKFHVSVARAISYMITGDPDALQYKEIEEE